MFTSDEDELLSFGIKRRDYFANDAELKWPTNIRILYHDDSVKICRQNTTIKTIIAETIHRAEVEILTENAFPEAGRQEEFRFGIAKQALKALSSSMENTDYKDAYSRAKKDLTFAHKIGELAVDRLAHHRGELRAIASTHGMAVYQLGIDEVCERRVASLLKGNYFVYNGHWGSGENADSWIIDSQTVYLNPAIILTLKLAWFGSERALGNRHQNLHVSLLPDHPNDSEFRIPLVALAATCVHAALSSWKTGFIRAKPPPFKAEIFRPTYKTFVSSLENFKAHKPAEFHQVMRTLYTAIGGLRSESSNSSLGDDPVAVFDLTGM